MSLTRRTFLALSGATAGLSAVDPAAFAQQLGFPGGHSNFDWPRNRALPAFPESLYLDAADLTALTPDEQGLLVTLQGIVNRTRPRLYFYWGTDPTNLEWLKTLRVLSHVTTNPWSLFERYRHEVEGAIVYDPSVPDTINLATTMAGLQNAVVASAELADRHKLRVLEDLRGKFADKFAVYNHALTNVWPRTTKRLMTAIGPSSTQSVPNVQWTTLLKVTQPVTDSSNTATYTIDLTSFLSGTSVFVKFQDAYPNDGWGPAVQQVTVTADGAPIASFQPSTDAEKPYLFDAGGSQISSSGWRFADGTEYFVYKFTPPAGTRQLTLAATMWNEFFVQATNTQPTIQVPNPLFRDYIAATSAAVFWLDPLVAEEAALFAKVLATFEPDAPYLGWFPNGDEMSGVTLCGQNSVPVVAADDFYNASVFSGVRAPIKHEQPKAKTPQLANKIYISFTLVEGDNIQYNQHRMRQMWDDPARGRIPLGWSISVLLADIAPAMLSYYQQTQTENDLLVAGPSGAGYTYPNVWPAKTLPGFLKRSGEYMQQTGMDILFAYTRDSSTDVPLSPGLVNQYKANIPNLQGIVYNFQTTSQASFISGLPVATLLGVNDATSGAAQLANIAASYTGAAPLFIAAGLESWNILPSDAVTLAGGMSSQFELVRPDTFFQLMRTAHKKGLV